MSHVQYASALRVLELVHKTGKSDIPDWQEGPEKAVDLPEHRAILRRAGGGRMLAEFLSKTIPAKMSTGLNFFDSALARRTYL
jgi:hypothetical protein